MFSCLCISGEKEGDFGFTYKIEISTDGEYVDIKGTNEITPFIQQIELLNYNGDGNNSGDFIEGKDCIEDTTDRLTVKYYSAEYRLIVIAEPNKTDKERELFNYASKSANAATITGKWIIT